LDLLFDDMHCITVRQEHIRLHNPQYFKKHLKPLREQQERQQQYQTGIDLIETKSWRDVFCFRVLLDSWRVDASMDWVGFGQ